MSRKQFIQSLGATCKNWTWSWSFINVEEKVIIFGAWDRNTNGSSALIFALEWITNNRGSKSAGFDQSREHIRLIEDEGYQLKTFPITYGENDDGMPVIKGFTPELSSKNLKRVDDKWYASDENYEFNLPEEILGSEDYFEGTQKKISINSYERNAEARKKCIEHHGHICAVCLFDFEKIYGELGKNYIHVHHIIPISQIKQQYKLEPVNDLIPVCPNCHAMIHRTQPALGIEQLKNHLSKMNK